MLPGFVLAGYWKTLRSPFDGLRANGGKIENIEDLPFVLSLSKHEHDFFSGLLEVGKIWDS